MPPNACIRVLHTRSGPAILSGTELGVTVHQRARLPSALRQALRDYRNATTDVMLTSVRVTAATSEASGLSVTFDAPENPISNFSR